MAIIGLKTGQRRDVRGIVATLQRGLKPTSRHSGQRRDVTEGGTKQRRDVEYQRRDVPETYKNPRRDVPETLKINVTTFESHVAKFQRRVKLTSRRWNVATLRSNVFHVTEKASKNLHIK